MKNITNKSILGIVLVLFIILFFTVLINAPGLSLVQTTFWIHNESDRQFSSYQQMKNISTDLGMITSASVSLTPTGVRCFPNNWTSENFTAITSVNGTWEFYFNYSTSASSNPVVYLFARIFKLNATGRFDFANSSQSTNVGGLAANINTGVNWNYTLPYSASANLSIGERIGIQICVNVTTAKNQNGNLYWENSTISRVIMPISSYDLISPTINFTNPSEVSGSYIGRSNALVNVSASDSNFKNLTIFLFNSTRNLINSSNTTSTNLFVNFTGLTINNIYYFNATAYDLAGNINSTETRNITIDTINPNINFTSPSETSGSIYTRRNIQINITLNDTNFRNATIYLYNTTSLVNSSNTTLTNLFVNYTSLADGVIVLYNIKRGDVRENAIEVLKMRGEKHQKKIVAMQITAQGVVVYPEQEVFSEMD